MNFEVKAIHGEPREWSSSHGGTFLSYKVDLEDQDRILERGVEWNKKDTSPAPSIGELVSGHLEEGKFGSKFKIDYEATKELTGSPRLPVPSHSESTSGSSQPRRNLDHSIARQVALKVLSPAISKEGFTPENKALTEHLERFILEAGQGADQGSGASGQADTAPPPAVSPASDQPPADDAPQYLQKLLEDAMVQRTTANALALFISQQFSLEQRGRAEDGLKHTDTQAATIQKLKTAYEQTENKLVPVDSDDDIPF